MNKLMISQRAIRRMAQGAHIIFSEIYFKKRTAIMNQAI